MSLREVLEETQPAWSPQDVAHAESRLAQIGVSDVASLAEALNGRLNDRLKQAGVKTFTADTVRAFRQRLRPAMNARAAAMEEVAEADAAGGGSDHAGAAARPLSPGPDSARGSPQDASEEGAEVGVCGKEQEHEEGSGDEAAADLAPGGVKEVLSELGAMAEVLDGAAARDGQPEAISFHDFIQGLDVASATSEEEEPLPSEAVARDVGHEQSAPRLDLGAFEGRWVTAAGRPAADIRAGAVVPAGALPQRILRVEPDVGLVCSWFGEELTAQLDRDGQRLTWSDGDVWRRAPEAWREAVPAPPPAAEPSPPPTAAGASASAALAATLATGAASRRAEAGRGPPPGPRVAAKGPSLRRAAAAEAKAEGCTAWQAGSFEQAAGHFAEARRLDPADEVASGLLEMVKLEAWEQEGIPVFRLGTYRAAAELAERCRAPSFGSKSLGAAAFLAKSFAKAAQLLEEAVGLDPADEIARRLLETSLLRVWEERGVPALRLGSHQAAAKLAEQIEQVDEMSSRELREWYRGAGLPEESCAEDRDISDLLKRVTIWQALPLAELHRDCVKHGVPCSAADGERQRQQLVKQLLLQDRMGAWEARGYHARRIGDVYAVIQVVEAHERILGLSWEELLAWYTDLGFPEEKGLAADELRALMRRVAIWQALPLDELRQECVSCGLPLDGDAAADAAASADEQRRVLTDRLLIHDRMEAWERKGYQARRIGNVDEVIRVVAQHAKIGEMGLEELISWYRGCGFPEEPGLEATELASLFEKVTLWTALPLGELELEWQRAGGRAEDEASQKETGPEQRRLDLVDKLFLQERMAAWDRKGFRAHDIGDADKVLQVMDQHEQIAKMPVEELVDWYRRLGLPDEPALPHDELVRLAKGVSLWEALPLAPLQRECVEKGLEPKVGDGDEDTRRLLMEELLLHERMTSWEEAGFPARRIGRPAAVLQAVASYEHFRGMDDEELRAACAAAGLPAGSAAATVGAGWREELLRHVKTVVVWEALPLRELEEECRSRGLTWDARPGAAARGGAEEEQRREALVHRLKVDLRVSAALAPAAPAGAPAGPPPPPSSSSSPSVESLPPLVPGEAPEPPPPAVGVGLATRGPPDLMDWYAEDGGGAPLSPAGGGPPGAAAPGGAGLLARLEAWLASGDAAPEARGLVSRLLDGLQGLFPGQELAPDDLPDPDSAEYKSLLEELGFSALERAKLRRALRDCQGAA